MNVHNWSNRIDLGEYLRAEREAKSISRQDMANTLNVSVPYLSLLERGGIVSPGVRVLRLIAEQYNLGFDELVDTYYPVKKEERSPRGRKVAV